jgi:predicted nucleotidyltransferase component of viral defense system
VKSEDTALEIRRLAVIAMVSDDDLMQRLVFKGGNALAIGYESVARSSIDIDFSMEGDFPSGSVKKLESRIANVLKSTFEEHGYVAFDVSMTQIPAEPSDEHLDFWGGYQIEFKVISQSKYDLLKGNVKRVRKSALMVGPDQKRKFRIDISKHEYCSGKAAVRIADYFVYIYTPEMLVAEKLRAICQQMPEYRKVVKSHEGSERARDFFDIYTVCTTYDVDFSDPEMRRLVVRIFGAKRVPLTLLSRLSESRDFHKQGFDALRDTVPPDAEVQDFDFYFDFLLQLVSDLHSLWKEDSPLR